LSILEVVAEEDPALADALESVFNGTAGGDAALEVMLGLLAMEALNQSDGSSTNMQSSVVRRGGPLSLRCDGSVAFFMMLNVLAIEAEKSAAWIGRSIPSHKEGH